jgi:hypothetical protein
MGVFADLAGAMGKRPANVDDVLNYLKAVNEITLKRMEDEINAIKTRVGA